MNTKKIYILLLIVFSVKIVCTQDIPLSQRLIQHGYLCLRGWNSQRTPEDAKIFFNRAKRLFFYKRSVVNDAKLGLSNYYLVVNDTLNSIKNLTSVIGKAICKKIENSEFDELEIKNNDWDTYYATTTRIEIALDQKEFILAKKYLKYLTGYVKVRWTCGNGISGHYQFIQNTVEVLNSNGY